MLTKCLTQGFYALHCGNCVYNGPEISVKVEDLSTSTAGLKYCKRMTRGEEESSVVLHAGNIPLKHLQQQQQQQTYQTTDYDMGPNSFVLVSLNQTVNDGVAHSKNPRKCVYHVTFDLEHTLDAR